MSTKNLLEQATALRRDAKRVWFLASGPSPLHTSLTAAATALERAAGEQARADNHVNYRRRSA
jgi:hypothetical protein